MRYYTINYQDVIVDSGGDWDDFALSNDGAAATTQSILGASLWSQISGSQTRSFLNALFFPVRDSGNPIITRYRCDSPKKSRLFEQKITLNGDCSLTVSHELVWKNSKNTAKILTKNGNLTNQCAQCLRVECGNQWLETYAYSLSIPNEIQLNYSVCPDCKEAATMAIHDARIIAFNKNASGRR
ncbi:hypothetical protein [Thioclava kandeliae]|uniref:Uncharacterized protein n=1 Tax=Thioclava kandeliae TaxID=3070818 RepID=A0ABV1SME6_9RHOB